MAAILSRPQCVDKYAFCIPVQVKILGGNAYLLAINGSNKYMPFIFVFVALTSRRQQLLSYRCGYGQFILYEWRHNQMVKIERNSSVSVHISIRFASAINSYLNSNV